MVVSEILDKKRKGGSFSLEELKFILTQFDAAKLSYNEMIEFMTLFNQAYSEEECFNLAQILADSGDRLNLSENVGFCYDKHSVGGVSDATSFIYMSVLASLNQKVVKSTASNFASFNNTLTRFSVFKGFKPCANIKLINKAIEKCGVGVYENKLKLAPLDLKLYLYAKRFNLERGIPFIAASVMAKKMAVNPSVLIVDVKCGEGGLVHSLADAELLAGIIVGIGKRANIKTAVVITNLDQPVSAAVGSRVEVDEVIRMLSYGGTAHVSNLLVLSREMVVVALMLSGVAGSRSEANEMFDSVVESGAALEQFYKIVSAHGGSFSSFIRISDITSGYATTYLTAEDDGYIHDVDTYAVNVAGFKLMGSGSKFHDDNAGLVLMVREGDRVHEGDKLVRIFYSFDNPNLLPARKMLKSAISVKKFRPDTHSLFYKVVI